MQDEAVHANGWARIIGKDLPISPFCFLATSVTWALLALSVLAVRASLYSVDGDSAESPRAWQSRYAEPRSDSGRDNATAAGPVPEISDACGERQLPTGQFPPFARFDRGTA